MKLIGIGNVGKVYLVQLKGTNHYFAMKILVKRQMEERNKTNRVITERDILLQTRHPFIVHLYWSFATETCFYFIMDYCGEETSFMYYIQLRINVFLKKQQNII